MLSILFLGLPVRAEAPQTSYIAPQPTNLHEYAVSIAHEYSLNTEAFTRVIGCESHWKADAIGDGGTSYGIAQIHLPAHPDVSREQALDPKWAIRWMAQQWANNRAYWWSCWKILYA